jgi:MYXO-CTERM domain-containing protein
MTSSTRSFASLLLACCAALALAPSSASALGNDALIYVAPSALTISYGGLESQLRTAGAPNVDTIGNWSAGVDLAARYRLVIVTPYDGPLDPAVGDDLAAFAAVGGGIVIMSEHDFGLDAGNGIATRLGLAARFAPQDTGGGCSSTPLGTTTSALTTGMSGLDFAWACEVTGGTLLAGTSAPIVTTEGTVVLAGDSDIFSDAVAFGGCPYGPDNERFFTNLYTSLADPTRGTSGGDGGGGGPDGGVTMPSVGMSCTASTDCASGICLDDPPLRYCTIACTDTCPNGFSCSDVGGSRVCLAPRTGGGCSASPASRGTASWLVLALGLLLVRARRRQPA